MNDLLQIAKAAAKSAGKCLDDKHNVILNKNIGKDIKLQTDVELEKLIIEKLISTKIDILSEESGFLPSGSKSDFLWIVDPLDGSLNFFRELPIFCVSIALWQKNKPVLGVIYDHTHKALYHGVVGQKAFLNKSEIQVSNIESKEKAIIATGFPVYSSFEDKPLFDFVNTLQSFKKVRLLGSAALSLAFLAKGSVDAYKENNIAFWDVAAGIALVLAAGGKVDYRFSKENNRLMNVFAHNGLVK